MPGYFKDTTCFTQASTFNCIESTKTIKLEKKTQGCADLLHYKYILCAGCFIKRKKCLLYLYLFFLFCNIRSIRSLLKY